jgi:hypothetical protein
MVSLTDLKKKTAKNRKNKNLFKIVSKGTIEVSKFMSSRKRVEKSGELFSRLLQIFHMHFFFSYIEIY